MAVVELPYTTAAPGRVSWLSVMPASTSALCVTSVPASVTGDEPPAIAIERMLTATCSRAPVMMISQVSWTSLSGLTGQVMNEMIGRALSLLAPAGDGARPSRRACARGSRCRSP